MPATKNIFVALSLMVMVYGCKKKIKKRVVVIRDVAEVEAEDRIDIDNYLEGHCYNYEDFKNPQSGFDYKVRISTLKNGYADKIPLSRQVKEKKVVVNGVEHVLYYIIVKEGTGESPKFTDFILASQQGELLNMTKFSIIPNPIWSDLTKSIRGLQHLIPFLKAGTVKHTENDDGTVTFPKDSGIGIFIIPSRLAYYNELSHGIPPYSPLVFSMTLHRYKEADHDKDGVPSYLEDLNRNDSVYDDDTDGNSKPNYEDSDDDGDGTLTKDEYDVDKDGVIDDTDGDGTPDYLDKT